MTHIKIRISPGTIVTALTVLAIALVLRGAL